MYSTYVFSDNLEAQLMKSIVSYIKYFVVSGHADVALELI